ncbi:ABC transporter substrate-binding protein [Celeribacter indicus]|uniref:ABC transporter substrate-binding protein n=1 Tax=Celeribacter indicus TaxID=1208324 RepID=A0A0B5DMI2_9RHOB|nr:ABC transporter substrate-binding protein [Celeribacter indicus]AJE44853.1 ABC transporter substrate-binding protein [Celeribacter indicus]SDX23490.1 amino acid/amide ABC transporter substrate-binding protein, HAAT family [Celeribacter indicus]
MSGPTLSQRLLVSGSLPRLTGQTRAPVRLGFLIPMSGREQGWGLPGYEGCKIWADWINAHGGLMVGGRRRRIELRIHDSATGAEQTLRAARDMVEQDGVPLVFILGGNDMGPALDYLMARKTLVATLLPSDLSPDRPYLIAPAEVHPLFNVTGVEWLARTEPAARRVALCSQEDLMGLPSLAVYRAAFEARGREIVREIRYEVTDRDASAMVAAMLEREPDILCWCSSPPPMVKALTEAAYRSGFTGHILSCTGDNYDRMIARTSPEFMERFIFQFPDFDDPKLADKAFFFHRPKAFFDTYRARFPGAWGAVSWEYASILDLWHNAVELADSLTPVSVLAAMKRGRRMPHAFGPASWWGEEIFGIDNALVGDWPVVGIRDGKATILEFGSVLDWLDRHGADLRRHLSDLGQLWDQRLRTRQAAGPAPRPVTSGHYEERTEHEQIPEHPPSGSPRNPRHAGKEP